MRLHSRVLLVVCGGLLTSCRDASHDIICLVPLPQSGIATNPHPLVLLNGSRVGELTTASIRSDSSLLAVIEVEKGIQIPKNAVFQLKLASLLSLSNSYAIHVKTSNRLSPPFLTTHDTVRVLPYIEPHGTIWDSTSTKLLDSLIRHVGRQLRSSQQ